MEFEILKPIIGGALIGLAASSLLLGNGRVMGISGILNGALQFNKGESAWRWSFVLGVIFGGFAIFAVSADSFVAPDISLATIAVSGFLVGLGTIVGNGCTTGHGVCGISRLSSRSLLATITFMSAGILTVYLLK